MNTIETIAARRSIRKFTEVAISEEEITTLIAAGMNAPSARNTQPWHLMIIRNRETINSIIEICPNGSLMKGADTAILVLGDLNDTDDYFVIDCAAAVQNILLAAHELKLGTCWIGVYPREPRVEGLKKLFSLPEQIIPHSLIALGHPAESKPANNNYRENRIHMEKW
ncbi:MAG: nitroreductase family protein [Spirochaetales bacterium]|nr:nitroreductase family protein [Spirochaetales bacterium]